jgi:nucleoid DNA-binding protein
MMTLPADFLWPTEQLPLTLVFAAPTLGASETYCEDMVSNAHNDHFSEENRVVTKKEIVRTISEEIGLTQLQTKEIVQKTFDAIVKALVAERRIELRNFGVFEVKRRAPRKARNPRTGDKVFVPEKFVVTFKPGKEMEERVKELERQAAAVRGVKTKVNSNTEPVAQTSGTPTGYASDGSDT